MSDASLIPPGFSDDACDEGAPTERDPGRATATSPPPRGVALSVLWWLEGEAEDARSAASNDSSAGG
jgi:hypothetical protein